MNKSIKVVKYVVVALFLAISVLCAIFMGKVNINYNISDYLNAETETKISLEIIEDEFGLTGDIQVMVENVTPQIAEEIAETIRGIDNVLTVSFDAKSEDHFKGGDALFTVLVSGDEYSNTARSVVPAIENALSDTYGDSLHLGGTVPEKILLRNAIQSEIVTILIISLCLVAVLMLITSKSWIEPLILLASSGIAVLINMGTNAFFGEISYITNAVAAILQLALSIDYSIVLLHAYRANKERETDKHTAMLAAIKEVVRPVSASALTTVAGLLALLFMSFRIGFDIGSVLMKSIVISAITALTLLPALLLIFDKILEKTKKPALSLKGEKFCNMAFKGGKFIAPTALALIVICGVLQFGNSYSFTDSSNKNEAISEKFGQNGTVIVVYENGDAVDNKEEMLAIMLKSFKKSDGSPVLKKMTSTVTTVKELYDVKLASEKLGISEEDANLIFTAYQFNKTADIVRMSSTEFIEFTNTIINGDSDAAKLAGEEMKKAIGAMMNAEKLMNTAFTAEEFIEATEASGFSKGEGLSLFPVKQIYGLYAYDSLPNTKVSMITMLEYLRSSLSNPYVSEMLDDVAKNSLAVLITEINTLKTQVNTGVTLNDFVEGYAPLVTVELAGELWSYYGRAPEEQIPIINVLNALVLSGQAPQSIIDTVTVINTLLAKADAELGYDGFITGVHDFATTFISTEVEKLNGDIAATMEELANANAAGDAETAQILTARLKELEAKLGQLALQGDAMKHLLKIPASSIQQLYIMYFYDNGIIPETKITGRDLAAFISKTAAVNPTVSSFVTPSVSAMISDLAVIDKFYYDSERYNAPNMLAKLATLAADIKSFNISDAINEDTISGLFILRAAEDGNAVKDLNIRADRLLSFVLESTESGLLANYVNDEQRAKIEESKKAMDSGLELLVSDNYSRILLTVDLPAEGEDSSAFVEYLSSVVDDVFGDTAHIAGEIVSTHDLKKSFDYDNKLISVITIVSIFLIILVVFRSISLPVLLVAIIQGAIWIAMSTSLITGPMFFMSYIMAICILMGATIDYGILMSTSYVNARLTLSKKDALIKAVNTALPTVFTSGLILMICGFVVGLVASQASISTVGFLLFKGTLVSTVMITLVLPSVLYLLDGFILKLTMRKKAKPDDTLPTENEG